jgi:hypothetical protein
VGDGAEMLDGDLPASPPAEVLDALDIAARVLGGLSCKGRNLQLSVRATDAIKTVLVEVCDDFGAFVCGLTSRQLLELLAGTRARSHAR